MSNFLSILLAIIIEIVIYCLIPTMIRLLRKKLLSKKSARYIVVVNYGIVFTLWRVLLSKLTNVSYSEISADLLPLLLTVANYFILTYENKITNNTKGKKKETKKNNNILIISLILAFIITSSVLMITSNNNKERTDETNNVVSYDVKEIKSQSEFEKIISNKDYTVILFTYSGCPFCKESKPDLESFSKSNKLTNVYHLVNDNNDYDLYFEIEGYPTYAIYRNNQFIAELLGSNNDSTLAAFLRENGVME